MSGVIVAIILVVVTILIWNRNRDILRDLYDHATMIGAAGKLHAGLKPYVDVRSPMQTSVYYFNWAAEMTFGKTYLGLTCGGLVQALGGGLLIGWMVARKWSFFPAVVVSGTIALAGLIQHTEFFYNPIGLVCFTLVVVGLARGPALCPPRTVEAWLVLGALFVGGTNKLNFQGLTLAVAGLLLLRSRLASELTTRALLAHIAVLVGCGLAAPVCFELAWTGASFHEWLDQVVRGPVARYDAARHVFELRNFIQPPHDFHHHILFRSISGFGLLLLVSIGGWAIARPCGPATGERILIGLLTAVGITGASLLMVTNYETVLLTSLAFLVIALALFLACRSHAVADRWPGRVILACATVWMINGAYAAWHGSRVLYAQNPPQRSEYERLVNAPKPLAYFEGVRFERDHLASLRILAAKMQSLEGPDGRLTGVLFGPAAEWLERAYPESMVRGMPIWYHHGTSLFESDGPWFARTMAAASATRIVAHPMWEIWPLSIAHWKRDNFLREQMGDRYAIYHPHVPSAGPIPTAAAPVTDAPTFRVRTNSNVLITATKPGFSMDYQDGPHGTFWGSSGSSEWVWPFPVQLLAGSITATLPAAASNMQSAIFRIFVADDAGESLLWELPVELSSGRRDIKLPFSVRPNGRRLRLEVAATLPVTAGWRDLRIIQSGESNAPVGLPFWPGLGNSRDSHLGAPLISDILQFSREDASESPAARLQVPFEGWRFNSTSASRVRVLVDLSNKPPETANTALIVGLIWYRSGRFEVIKEQTFLPGESAHVVFDGELPEPCGWVGLLVRSVGGEALGQLARIDEWVFL